MSFGPHTVLKLTVDACATLPDVKLADVGRNVDDDLRDKAQRESEQAKKDKDKAWDDLILLGPSPTPPTTAYNAELERLQKAYLEKANAAQAAEEKHKQLTIDSKTEKQTRRPNAFVTVTLDEDAPGSEPIVFTHTYRDDKRPFWHETFNDIPIGLLAHGKWGRQLLSGTQSPYCPTRLNFWVYHDIGDDQKGSDEVWKRDSPKRDLLIGRACLNFGSLVCDGCENWHELAVLDQFENPLPTCRLRVKTQMCTSSPDAVLLTRPIQLPGGVVCGKADAKVCTCGTCQTAPEEIDMHFPRPVHMHTAQKHKTCKAKKKKTKCKNRHVHYHE